jgi:hydroxymethylglutaryl-CoA reductase
VPIEEASVSFRKLSPDERVRYLRQHADLTADECALLQGGSLDREIAEHLIENSIGYFQLPLGIATQFVIDGRPRLIPMAVEETSIIAAASAMAKWVATQGSLTTRTEGSLIIGQIQLPRVRDPEGARARLMAAMPELLADANALAPGLVARGGGVREIRLRELRRPDGDAMWVLHVLCDPCDAMGANLINQICEGLKPRVEELSGERVGLCILSNLVDEKLAIAEVEIRDIDPVVGEGIVEAALFAKLDPYRATTHNKGVLNGIDPILIATGNDWRAVEAGIHAYAARSGTYQPVTDWWLDGTSLRGRIVVPIAVGIVGGVTKLHPLARASLKILQISQASDLARICAAVGLIQNLGALKALSTVGIVRGHMELHAANLALAAGSNPEELVEVRRRLGEVVKDKKSIGLTLAQQILREIRANA